MVTSAKEIRVPVIFVVEADDQREADAKVRAVLDEAMAGRLSMTAWLDDSPVKSGADT